MLRISPGRSRKGEVEEPVFGPSAGRPRFERVLEVDMVLWRFRKLVDILRSELYYIYRCNNRLLWNQRLMDDDFECEV